MEEYALLMIAISATLLALTLTLQTIVGVCAVLFFAHDFLKEKAAWVKEVHHTVEPTMTKGQEDAMLNGGPDMFYEYIISKNNAAGKIERYDVWKIDSLNETIVCIGREQTLSRSRRLVREHEPNGTNVVKQSVKR